MRDVKIPNWLSGLPLAPEFRPTDTEFADPIAYISKIEKEASAFGICKVIPPLPKPSKKFVLSNLNKSLSKCPELGLDVNIKNVRDKRNNGGEVKAFFTTRQQELGQSGKRTNGVPKPSPPIYKQVWQSGEIYTLEKFESKSKIFARSQLGMVKQVSPSVIEALFWKAASEKPMYVEYANDVPGSGFGEPDGSAQCCRRTSRRTVYRNSEEDSESKKGLTENITSNDKNGCASNKFNPSSVATTSSNVSPDRIARLSREKISGHGNEVECTSGQILSNSPWNLQVIAQSPGSLTRFMPDDIPGVTSPMVYIGMLFSWFAWHVEDHELNSLNFLHTGSPKTWYAVPGEYALTFEEVIRNQAYGGNIDRLAALTLLGEKTTLLSPEVIVASGIPCCRLVQNPGEFVITFPRAYHVGFSHGFNCGEAANFGTPKWLTLAKEAAVRRAAMNHLPMLSHQQLLYLLTMSFISRVPRSLMPGVRSSRLRDRQKEERELLVKKAFVEDIINENDKLTFLLQKNSSYRAVLWDLELLPSSHKGSDLVNSITDMTRPKQNISKETDYKHELLNQNLYMEYVDDADLSSEFQVDSGALPCVACGLLGFPFMCAVQPSKEALVGILSAHPIESTCSLFFNRTVDASVSDVMKNQDITIKDRISSACARNIAVNTQIMTEGEINLTNDCMEPSRNTRSFSSSDVEDEVKASRKLVQKSTGAYPNLEIGESMFCREDYPSKDLPSSSIINFSDGPNTYSRPRIFCLEHAIQVEELLCGKGGADVLVICHSDFKKIKLHAAAVAEEIGSPFSYQEVLLDNASPGDLKLINFAIDDEGQDECSEDWTSTVKINLRHCLKLFKKIPSEELQHALTLKGLCFDKAPNGRSLSFKWNSTKLRSKRRKLNQSESKSSDSTLLTKDEALDSISDVPLADKQVKLLHYVRRFKSKNSGSVGASKISEDSREIFLPVGCSDLEKNRHIAHAISIDENTGRGSSEMSLLVATEPSDLQQEIKCSAETRTISEISVLSQVKSKLLYAKPVSGNVTSQIENNILEEMTMKDKACGSATSNSQMPQGIKVAVNSSENNVKCSKTSARSPEVAVLTTAACQTAVNVQVEKENQMTGPCSQDVNYDMVIAGNNGGLHNIQDNGDASMKEVCDPTISEVLNSYITKVERLNEQIEKPLIEVNIGADRCPNLECRVQPLFASTKEVSGPTISKVSDSDITKVETLSEQIGKSPEVAVLTTVACQIAEDIEVERENQMTEGSFSEDANHNPVIAGNSSRLHDIQDNGDASMKEVYDPTISKASDSDITKVERLSEQIVNIGAFGCPNLECEVQPKFASTKGSQEDSAAALVNLTPSNKSRPISAEVILDVSKESAPAKKMDSKGEIPSLQDMRDFDRHNSKVQPGSVVKNNRKRKRELDQLAEEGSVFDGFIRSPCEGLRPRAGNSVSKGKRVTKKVLEEKSVTKKAQDSPERPSRSKNKIENRKASHKCDIEGCKLRFKTIEELRLHKRNQCPHEGCGKKFNSHKNAVIHLRVHDDNRPLKCPWKGCTKSFKWAWARTEHLRVHTGEKPYKCKVEGCGQTFRFVSDYSRHRRKTGHYVT